MVGIKEKVFILLEGHGSQKRLAEAIGLTDKAVSAWKKNNAGGDIATETSKKIAKYFNVPLQLLVDDSIKLVEQWRDDQYDDFRIGDDEDKRSFLSVGKRCAVLVVFRIIKRFLLALNGLSLTINIFI